MEKHIRIINDVELCGLMEGQESKILRLIKATYITHLNGKFANPQSTLLTVPGCPMQRAWALPAYVGDDHPALGIKWIASFPENIQHGLERASGVIVLNSLTSGRPQVILDAGRISAIRTAASAVIASQHFQVPAVSNRLGIIGCGRINSEVLRLLATVEELNEVFVYDVEPMQITNFLKRIDKMNLSKSLAISSVDSLSSLFEKCELISIATTAIKPHIQCWQDIRPGSVVLHISLRDLPAEAILAMDNVVDDIHHVFRDETSIHLAYKLAGNKNFVRTTIGEILCSKSPPRDSAKKTTCFSPFGLGILDIAVARYLADLAQAKGVGSIVNWS